MLAGVILNVGAAVSAAWKARGIFRNEPSSYRIQITRPVVVKIGFRVEFASGIAEEVRQRPYCVVLCAASVTPSRVY